MFFWWPCFESSFGPQFVIVLGLCLDTIWKRIRAEAFKRRPKNPSEGVPHWVTLQEADRGAGGGREVTFRV